MCACDARAAVTVISASLHFRTFEPARLLPPSIGGALRERSQVKEASRQSEQRDADAVRCRPGLLYPRMSRVSDSLHRPSPFQAPECRFSSPTVRTHTAGSNRPSRVPEFSLCLAPFPAAFFGSAYAQLCVKHTTNDRRNLHDQVTSKDIRTADAETLLFLLNRRNAWLAACTIFAATAACNARCVAWLPPLYTIPMANAIVVLNSEISNQRVVLRSAKTTTKTLKA